MAQEDKASVQAAMIGGIFALIAACIGGVFLVINTILPTLSPVSTVTPVPQSIPTQIASLQSEIKLLRQELDALNQSLATNPNADNIQLQAKIRSLDERLTPLEQVILDNPARVLELTLLSRDIENLKTSYQAELENTRKEIDRVYAFSQWFLAAIITLALGLSSLVASDFLKRRSQPREASSQDENNGKK